MKEKLVKNKILFYLGLTHLFIFIVLFVYSFFNNEIVLGINAMIKPMKFALSIWVFSWTMSLILNYVNAKRKVKEYSIVAFICMCFEQASISIQALRGTISHFNIENIFGIILYSLMGVFIITVTLWTAYITFIFIKQKNYNLHPVIVFSIKIGLIYFVIFSMFGGYISGLQGHTIGSADGGNGLWFLNWSTLFGDLRVAHFFGIHSLQIIPLFAIVTTKFFDDKYLMKASKIFSVIYLCFIISVIMQGLCGIPFIKQ